MSNPLRIALVGATGMIGRAIMEQAIGRDHIRLLAIARRHVPLPKGARMEMIIAEANSWGEIITNVKPDVVICALGTTMKKAGRDEAAFREVDEALVLAMARAANVAGVPHFISVSAVGADAMSRIFYSRVKGEVEEALRKIAPPRLDVLRPGLLRGKRQDDLRIGEKISIVLSPLIDLCLQGDARKYRSISASDMAAAALFLAQTKTRGRYSYEHDELIRNAKAWARMGE